MIYFGFIVCYGFGVRCGLGYGFGLLVCYGFGVRCGFCFGSGYGFGFLVCFVAVVGRACESCCSLLLSLLFSGFGESVLRWC